MLIEELENLKVGARLRKKLMPEVVITFLGQYHVPHGDKIYWIGGDSSYEELSESFKLHDLINESDDFAPHQREYLHASIIPNYPHLTHFNAETTEKLLREFEIEAAEKTLREIVKTLERNVR